MYRYVCMLWPLETESYSKITFCRLVLLILIFPAELLPKNIHLGSIHTIKHLQYLGVQNLHVFSPVSSTRSVKKGSQLSLALRNRSYQTPETVANSKQTSVTTSYNRLGFLFPHRFVCLLARSDHKNILLPILDPMIHFTSWVKCAVSVV